MIRPVWWVLWQLANTSTVPNGPRPTWSGEPPSAREAGRLSHEVRDQPAPPILGQLRGVGRTHTGTHVFVQDLDIRIINATRDLLRELVLNPTPALPGHQTATRPAPKKQKPVNPQPQVHGFPMS
jgi:hypothetical protein